MWADDPRHAELLLRNFQSANLGLEAERLFLLYAIVKTEAKVDEMARINSDLQARAPDNPYAKLVYGVQECIYGDCSSVVPELEEANRSIDVDLAKAYLAVAYAYSGRFRDAEALFDQTRGGAMAFDEAVVYVAVGTYLKVSRPDDARSLGVGYFDAHPELEGSFFRQETKKLLEMAE